MCSSSQIHGSTMCESYELASQAQSDLIPALGREGRGLNEGFDVILEFGLISF